MQPVNLTAGSRWLHCSGIAQAISTSACDTVFEAIARTTLAQCDLFFPSIDEVAALNSLSEPKDVIA